MFRRKLSLGLSLLLAASLVLSACSSQPAKEDAKSSSGEQTTQTDTAKKGEPAVGGQLILRMDKDPDNFNPILSGTAYGSMVIDQVYATLFEFNENWEPEPYVAESWEFSNDNKTLTIKIREGIKFHDGAELTAEDVVFTLGTLMDPDYTGPRASSMEPVESIKALDKYTVEINLKYPYAPLFEDLNYGILQKKLFEGYPIAEMEKHPVTMEPVGAGPYKFVEYKRGQYVLLERNDEWFMSDHYNGAPYIKELLFKVIPEDSTALAALENGELDVDTPPPSEVSRLKQDYKDQLIPIDYKRNGWGYMTFNVTRPHLDNKLVRQALTYGLDRQSIIDGVMDGRAVIPPGPIPPVSWAYDPSIKPFPYDPEKARELLEQAGYTMGEDGYYYKDGEKLKLGFYASAGSSLIEGIAAIAKNNWKEIGVELDVQLMDFNALIENYMKPGKFDISFSGFNLGLDPDQYVLWHSSQVNGFNRGRYSNPDVDRLLEEGRKVTDPAERKKIYSEFQKIWVDDAPAILIYSNNYTDMVSTKVKGGIVNFPGSGASKIYRWWIEEK